MANQVGIGRTAAPAREVVKSVLRRALDRMVAVGYGVLHDYLFESFEPYRSLQQEVLKLVERSVPDSANRREIRILELGCGPGNFALKLAEAGFSVVGLDRYGSLIDLAREKRHARRLANLAFQHADLASGTAFRDGSFDQIVNIHSLYVHPRPDVKLREAHRVLRPSGRAIFVNHTRRIAVLPTFRDLRNRHGLAAGARSLLWLVPNAIFEAARKQVGPTYWSEAEFRRHVEAAGFVVLETRRTFLNGASLLVWALRGGDGVA